ncbi:MAG TPA: TonB-dependent receptor, partial [Pedobacter sp.]
MTLFKKLIGTFLLLFLLLAFAPMDPDPLQKLVNSLQKWTDDNPQEKVYLHMDKPYYALGDTIWFKAYITTGSRHQLSAISGALYVDLITEKDSLVRTLKLPVNAGMSMGDLTLGDDLQQGNYRIRAYTQWMRNAGEDYFFDRTFTVGTLLVNEIVSTSKYRYETIDDNTSLIATLGYTDKEGIPLADEKVEYDIILNNQKVYSKSVRTNDLG